VYSIPVIGEVVVVVAAGPLASSVEVAASPVALVVALVVGGSPVYRRYWHHTGTGGVGGRADRLIAVRVVVLLCAVGIHTLFVVVAPLLMLSTKSTRLSVDASIDGRNAV